MPSQFLAFRFLNSLYGRFLFALILVGIIPFALITLILVRFESQTSAEQTNRELTSLALVLSDELEAFLNEILQDSAVIASLPEIASMDPARQELILYNLYNQYERYGQLAVANSTGQIQAVGREMPLGSIAHIDSFQMAKKTGQQAWWVGPAPFDETIDLLHLHTPIRNDTNEIVGVLGSPVTLPGLSEFLAVVDLGNQGEIFVLDATGQILLHPDPTETHNRRDLSVSFQDDTGNLPNQMGTITYLLDDTPHIAGYAPVDRFGWLVVVSQPEAETFASVIRTRNLALIGLAISSLLSLLAAIVLARGLASPVHKLAIAAQALGQGQFDVPLPEDITYDADLHTLVTTFKEMRQAVLERERGLTQSEVKNQAILNAIPDLLFYVRDDGQILDHKGGRIGEFELIKTGQLLNQNFYQMLPTLLGNKLAGQIATTFRKVLADKQEEIVEFPLAVNNQELYWELRILPGASNDALVIIKNITEQKQAETTIHKQLSAIEASIDGISIIKNGLHIYVNNSYAKIYGYTDTEALIGQPWHILYEQNEQLRLEQDVFPLMYQTGEWRGNVQGAHRDTPTFPLEMSLTLIADDEFVCVIRDISERKASEEAMWQMQKTESLGVLAGGIAHDFNNLLTSILGNTSLAQLDLNETQAAYTYLGSAITSAKRAADLTRQLLAYTGKGKFQIEPINVNQLIRENVGLLETAIPKQADLKLDLKSKLSLIEADKGQIQQVVMNLVINAAEAISEVTGEVMVRTGEFDISYEAAREIPYVGGAKLIPGKYVCIQVTDTGVGMDEETRDRIFDPFFSTKVKGHGLGLSATLGIIRSHHGGLQLESVLDQGTTFRVFLPASDADHTMVPETGTMHTEELTGNILVVDDDEAVCRLARNALSMLGLEVFTATNGLEGLEIFKAQLGEIDLVILDMKMPVMDGEEMYRHLADMAPNTKVVFCSGYSDVDISTLFNGHTNVTFLPKPYAIATLLATVQERLQRN